MTIYNDEDVEQVVRDFVSNQQDIAIDRYSDVGCNGFVYFGKHNIFGERVALKFYYVDKGGLSHKEPQIMRELSQNHVNILKVHDAKMISDKYAYFLTPEICGGDLDSFFRNTNLSTLSIIEIIQDILKGLSQMHKRPYRLVHRDLKPNNILIDNLSNRAIIADFGSIKHIPLQKSEIVASKNSLVYRPKEAVVNNLYSFQSDIYQAGIILYQLLGGFFPIAIADWLTQSQYQKAMNIKDGFEQHSFIERIIDDKIIRDKLLDYDSLPLYTDKKLKSIIKTATSPNLAKRYGSASEFLSELMMYKNKAIDWMQENNCIYAVKHSGVKYRISKTSKSIKLEKTVKNGEPRHVNSGHAGTVESMIEYIRNN